VKDKCVSKSLRLKNIRGNLEVERKYYRKDNTKLKSHIVTIAAMF